MEAAGVSDSCPHLLESMPCEDPVCFQWHVASEGACATTQGACGPGTANQTIVCVSTKGTAASLIHLFIS